MLLAWTGFLESEQKGVGLRYHLGMDESIRELIVDIEKCFFDGKKIDIERFLSKDDAFELISDISLLSRNALLEVIPIMMIAVVKEEWWFYEIAKDMVDMLAYERWPVGSIEPGYSVIGRHDMEFIDDVFFESLDVHQKSVVLKWFSLLQSLDTKKWYVGFMEFGYLLAEERIQKLRKPLP